MGNQIQVSHYRTLVEKRHGKDVANLFIECMKEWDGGEDVRGAYYDLDVLKMMEDEAVEKGKYRKA